MERIVAIEHRTAGAYQAAIERLRNDRVTAEAVAQLIDRTIVPELQAADARLEALDKVPAEHQTLIASAEEYLNLRSQSWRLRAEGLRERPATGRLRAEAQHRASLIRRGKAEVAQRASLEALQRITPVIRRNDAPPLTHQASSLRSDVMYAKHSSVCNDARTLEQEHSVSGLTISTDLARANSSVGRRKICAARPYLFAATPLIQ